MMPQKITGENTMEDEAKKKFFRSTGHDQTTGG